MVGSRGARRPWRRVVGGASSSCPVPTHAATRTSVLQYSWFKEQSLHLSQLHPRETEHWTKFLLGIDRKSVQSEQLPREQGNRGLACVPGDHVAVCFYADLLLTPTSFSSRPSTSSNRDNKSVLLTLHAQNYLGNGWFQGVGTTRT